MADGGDTVSNGGDDVLGIEYEGTGNGDTSVTEITEEDAGLAIGELESETGWGIIDIEDSEGNGGIESGTN